MTQRLYLHVGAPKSGTTFIQRILADNRALLRDSGVLVVGERHVDRVHAGLAVREDPRLTKLPPEAAAAWKRLAADIVAWDGELAILSYELFAGASADQVQAALADLAGIEVHVVITARDFGLAVSSAWQERLKFALTTPLERWVPRPESDGPRAEWGWRTMDAAGVAARWGAGLPPERVHIVTAPRDRAGDELWTRFARACRIDDVPVDVNVDRVNESLGAASAEVLRRVNERLPAELGSNREQALWLRDVLAHQVLALLDDEPIAITDEQFAEAQQRSEEAVAAIEQAGYDVVGDLDDIRATRREGRAPSAVADSELLSASLDAVVRLLLLLRERSGPRPGGRKPAEPAGPATQQRRPGLRALSRRIVQAAALEKVQAELADAEAKIKRMESDLRASRQLQLRVAELTDLVSELLLPQDARDDEALVEALRRFRKESV